MSELSVLKHLCNLKFYTDVRDKIQIDSLSKEVHPILRALDAYHKTTEIPVDLSVDDLSNLFFSSNRNKIEFYQGVFDALRANQSTMETTYSLIDGLQQAARLRDLSLLAYDASEGRKSITDVLALAEGLSTCDENPDDEIDDFVSTDLVEIVNSSRNMEGLRWRLGSLNENLGPLRKGNFGFVFARPETGKTTFLASEVTLMAGQASQPILWFNNEQVGTEVMLYCYRAALGLSMIELHRDLEGNRKLFHETTKENFKLKDSATIHYKKVEKICAKYNPSLIVFDQIDKIKGFDNDREDLRLGTIYIWARELAKEYCPVIGVCQADGSGEGQRWLSMANVANAKTSKQAEADWILGIGRINEVGYDNLRFMHLSKNKLPGGEQAKPENRHGRWETLIDPERARYVDL